MIDGKLRIQVIGGAGGRIEKGCLLGSVRSGPLAAKAGEVLQDSACIYQAEVAGRVPAAATGGPDSIELGEWTVRRAEDGRLSATRAPRPR